MLDIAVLSPEQVTAMWGQLEPLFAAACAGNPIAHGEMVANDIYVMSQLGQCVVFACYEYGALGLAFAIQFYMTGEHKSADIIAMGGRNFVKFSATYWPAILEWLKSNGVKFVDAYVDNSRAKVFMKRLGFDQSCTYVRRVL